MDAANMPQGLGQLKTMEEMLMGTAQVQGSNPNHPAAALAPGPGGIAMRGGTARPQKEKAIDCPRCNSTNTKFCYYNNYSVQQPRYLCKTCRRYWTEGGALRNVPVGGGSRKKKRHSSFVASSSSMANNKNPKLAHDLNMNMALPDHHGGMQQAFPSLAGGGTLPGSVLSAMELLRSTGFYIPLPTPMPAGDQYGGEAEAGFTLGEFREPPQPLSESQTTLLGFTQLDAQCSAGGAASSAGYGSSAGMQGLQETAGGRLLFPFEGSKPTASSGAGGGGGHHQLAQGNEAQQGNGATAGGHDMPVFWNGMVGGGASW